MSGLHVLTIGHSNHPIEKFVELLEAHSVTLVADVRSAPHSKFTPQYNRRDLEDTLRGRDITYLFLGRELGARSEDPSCYEDGKVQYRSLAETALFKAGIERVAEATAGNRVALMCAEKEPLTCHRTFLVGRELEGRGYSVSHIHADGSLESNSDAMIRLLSLLKMPEQDLFRTREELIEEACARQEQKIAYVGNGLRGQEDEESA